MNLPLFSLAGRTALITGGTGVLGGALARGLSAAGARVAVMGRRGERAAALAAALETAGGEAMALPADVLDRDSLLAARSDLLGRWQHLDILVNAAGGNVPEALVTEKRSFFELAPEAFEQVVDLNLLGTVLPAQVFGEAMTERGGSIVNISSMAAQRTLTRVVGYSAAKAAIENLTRWLAVEFATRYGEGLRVNAVAPGFFLGEQNRALLVAPDGELTARGRQIVAHTPMRRFGEPEELIGTVIWLCSDASRFVTGVVVPVDGGFAAFGGV